MALAITLRPAWRYPPGYPSRHSSPEAGAGDPHALIGLVRRSIAENERKRAGRHHLRVLLPGADRQDEIYSAPGGGT